MTAETKTQHWLRRGAALRAHNKAWLCAKYRELGGLGGIHPPEKWTKDELANSIIDIEWGRLPEDRKLPEPPHYDPPCDLCSRGQHQKIHAYGGEHNYQLTGAGIGPYAEYPYLLDECARNRCDHPDQLCPRYRSQQCPGGTCEHAAEQLPCMARRWGTDQEEPDVFARGTVSAPEDGGPGFMFTPPAGMVPHHDTGELVHAGDLYADKCAECTTGASCEDARRCLFEG